MSNQQEMEKSGSFNNEDLINIQNNIEDIRLNQEESVNMNRDGLYLQYDDNVYNEELRESQSNPHSKSQSQSQFNKFNNFAITNRENEREREEEREDKFLINRDQNIDIQNIYNEENNVHKNQSNMFHNDYQVENKYNYNNHNNYQDSFHNNYQGAGNEFQPDTNPTNNFLYNESKYEPSSSRKSYGGKNNKNSYEIDYNDTFSKKQINFPEMSKVNQNTQFNYTGVTTSRDMNMKNPIDNESHSQNHSHSNNYLNLNNINLNNTNKSNEESNKLISQIMEKDKIIFEYSKLLKESERTLEKSKLYSGEKEDTIYKLKDEIKDLKFKLRNGENLLEKKVDELEKYKMHTEEKFLTLNKEKILFEEKYNDLAKLFENNHSDFQNTVFEYKKIENNLDKLKIQINEKEEIIKSNEKFIDELKKEIKQIPLLKKENYELEQQVKILDKEFQEEKLINERIIQSTNESEKKLAIIIEETKQGKEIMNNYMKQNYELENLKKELEFKESEIENFNERHRSLMKENDNFVQFFTNELTDFNCLMENINYYKTGIISGNSTMNNSHQNIISEKFSLKYEILNKNFDTLKKKYIENYNQNNVVINKLEKSVDEIEKINKEISNERDDLVKEITLLNQNIKDNNIKLNETIEENEKLNENLKNLKENYIKIKSDFEELNVKNENLCQETHMFLMNCKEKLKEKYPDLEEFAKNKLEENPNSIDNNFPEKILHYIDLLLEEYSKNKFSEVKLIENKYNMEEHIKSLNEEKENLYEKIENILEEKEKELNNLNNEKIEEINRQRKILYEKISSLTELLEDSNQIISSYEKENDDLKEKNIKFETNLKLLTNSHIELERSINGNFKVLQKENDEKELKYSNILRELEIKDTTIFSLESMLMRKDEEIQKLKESNKLFANANNYNEYKNYEGNNLSSSNYPRYSSKEFSNDINTNINSNVENSMRMSNNFPKEEFNKDHENENELKNLMNNYNDQKRKNSNSLSFSKEITQYDSLNTSMKIPGRIVSLKKK